ncbi:hypothetical protein FOZ63_029939, partial [Perkinsus olseni]
VEDGDLGGVSSPSSGEELVLSKAEAAEKQGTGKRRRRRKRKRKKRGSAANAQELQPVVVEGSASPSEEVISLASDFGRAEEEEVIGLEEVGELPMASEDNPNRTLWRVRRWATEMVSESSESSTSSDLELQSDLEEDGQQTPRWSADAHGSMSDFLWGLAEGGSGGSSSSSSGASNDPMEAGATFSAERTVDYMHRLCCAEGQLMRSLANGSNADPRERQTTCPRLELVKFSVALNFCWERLREVVETLEEVNTWDGGALDDEAPGLNVGTCIDEIQTPGSSPQLHESPFFYGHPSRSS